MEDAQPLVIHVDEHYGDVMLINFPDHHANIDYIASTLYERLVHIRLVSPLITTVNIPGVLLYRHLRVPGDVYITETDYSDKESMEQIAAQVNEKAGGDVKCFAVGYDIPFGNRHIRCEFTQ